MNMAIEIADMAKFHCSSIVHVMMPEELVTLTKTKGLEVIYLSRPTRTVINEVDNIHWSIDSTSLTKLCTLNLSSSNIAIATMYENLKCDKMLAFVGNFQGPTPDNNDHILLGLFLSTKIDPSEDDVNVQEFLNICDMTKYNINVGQSSGHHDSEGANFGFGARREYRIKEHNFSSVGSFATKT